ncbi:MAG: hypothetical protein Kow0020_15860 [Wenzhouxiangellaceae bacterium]
MSEKRLTQDAKHDPMSFSDSRYYAKKVTEDIVAKSDILDHLPRAGRKVPGLDNDNSRELLPYSYRVPYEIRSEDVFVLVAIHKRPQLQPAMVDR